MSTQSISYKRHRFPRQIIAHAVWLYARFNLSLREVEEILLERGINVSYETIRRWVIKFGPRIARSLRRRQARPGEVWHLDEVAVKIAGWSFWLWHAVDQESAVLEEILQPRRDMRAARRLLLKLMKRHGFVPKRIETDKLRSYGTQGDEQPGREQPSAIPKARKDDAGVRSPGGIQHFVSLHSATRNCFAVPSESVRSSVYE